MVDILNRQSNILYIYIGMTISGHSTTVHNLQCHYHILYTNIYTLQIKMNVTTKMADQKMFSQGFNVDSFF